MKSFTCKDVGGVCDTTFMTATFDELKEQSMAHMMEMKNEPEHKANQEAMAAKPDAEKMTFFQSMIELFENTPDQE